MKPAAGFCYGIPVNRLELTDRFRERKPILILAPLAELTHGGFRSLVDRYGGCDLFFTEMISASAHLQGGILEQWYVDTAPDPGRLVFQVVGNDAEKITEAAISLSRFKPAGIDINMGCSAPEIFRQGGGCAWMNKPEEAVRMVARIRERLSGDVSLSVKIRLGEEEDPNTLVLFCRELEKAGADFITLHPKTRREKHLRVPRWEHVSFIRQALTIPVVGNGHINDYPTAQKRFEESGCHGLMIGRGAVTEPWIFKRLALDFSGRHDPFVVDRLAAVEDFVALLQTHQPPEFHRTRAIRFSAWYHAPLFWGHRLHTVQVSALKDPEELTELYRAYFNRYPEERFKTVVSTL